MTTKKSTSKKTKTTKPKAAPKKTTAKSLPVTTAAGAIEVTKAAAQGDVMFLKGEIPTEAKTIPAAAGQHVVAHSETGHHHFLAADGRVEHFAGPDPFTCYLRVASGGADVIHGRSFDTHQTLHLAAGDWLVRRQREYTPEGFRRVED